MHDELSQVDLYTATLLDSISLIAFYSRIWEDKGECFRTKLGAESGGSKCTLHFGVHHSKVGTVQQDGHPFHVE